MHSEFTACFCNFGLLFFLSVGRHGYCHRFATLTAELTVSSPSLFVNRSDKIRVVPSNILPDVHGGAQVARQHRHEDRGRCVPRAVLLLQRRRLPLPPRQAGEEALPLPDRRRGEATFGCQPPAFTITPSSESSSNSSRHRNGKTTMFAHDGARTTTVLSLFCQTTRHRRTSWSPRRRIISAAAAA